MSFDTQAFIDRYKTQHTTKSLIAGYELYFAKFYKSLMTLINHQNKIEIINTLDKMLAVDKYRNKHKSVIKFLHKQMKLTEEKRDHEGIQIGRKLAMIDIACCFFDPDLVNTCSRLFLCKNEEGIFLLLENPKSHKEYFIYRWKNESEK